MTTKPKAMRFRIRRNAAPADAAATPTRDATAPRDSGGAAPAAPVAPGTAAGADDAARGGGAGDAAAQLDAIRREGLTGRQLRMARRLAQKHGLPATSDFDAVRLLRAQGINPFERAAMLELVVGRPVAGQGGQAGLPQTREAAHLPAADIPPPAPFGGERDIIAIQRDIARRRRRKSLMLFARLFLFVLLPTIIAGYYYHAVATPLYATRSEFVIQQAEAQGASQLGGLFSGTGFATSQDSITVQSYLQSRDAMLRLDADLGFKAHFADPAIDPIQRLAADATNEDAYKIYKRNVKIGYDPTEGLIRMEVIAADPERSAAFARALISYAEEQVDQLTQRLRGDQMEGARASFQEAEAAMLAAQRRVVSLQEQYNVLSSEVEVTLLTNQIGQLETQLTQERLALQELRGNAQPNLARIAPIEARIATLQAEIADLRAQLTSAGASGLSLAGIQGELMVAQAEVETRQMMLAQSLQQLESARIEANRQVRYLSLGVTPVVPDAPTYPRAFENTALALLIFGGLYLMLSMTVAILREQVSA